MTNYKIVDKSAFTVIGFGTTVQFGEGDDKFAHVQRQKLALWQAVSTDGRLDQLKTLSTDSRLLAVNEAINQEMWYYAGVFSTAEAPEGSRAINFPQGKYLVVNGTASNPGDLYAKLEGLVFGQVLPNLDEYAYVGGPNAAVETSANAKEASGEMWVPIIEK